MARGRRASRTRPDEPHRRCVGCRASKPRGQLLRLAVHEGQVVADAARRLPGRGCSLCRSEQCARAAIKTRSIGRALKGRAPDPSIDRLLGWIAGSG